MGEEIAPRPLPVIEHTRSLKALMDEARSDFERYLGDVSKAETEMMQPEWAISRSLSAQTAMEARRLAYEMRASDWQQARFEESVRRSEEQARRSHRLNVFVAVWIVISSVATAAQAYAIFRAPTNTAPVTSNR